jgi:hypothetical protein
MPLAGPQRLRRGMAHRDGKRRRHVMKASPRADYPVSVLAASWEKSDPGSARLYEGIYTVTLNHRVDICFVPDISDLAPPWDGRGLPADFDEIATVDQARYAGALVASYVVTPNAQRSGGVDRFRYPAHEPRADDTLVRYVDAAEFARFAADLESLTDIVGTVRPDKTVLDLRDYEVIRWIEAQVVAAPWFGPRDAAWLGRTGANPSPS